MVFTTFLSGTFLIRNTGQAWSFKAIGTRSKVERGIGLLGRLHLVELGIDIGLPQPRNPGASKPWVVEALVVETSVHRRLGPRCSNT